MKKTILTILLCGVMVLGLTGCKNKITDISSNMEDNCNHKAQLLLEQKDRKFIHVVLMM